MELNKKNLYNALANILSQNDKATAKLERGHLAFTPSHSRNIENRLTYSRKGIFPTKKEGDQILDMLMLHLRAKTRKLGHVVISEIKQQRHKQIGIYGCTVFTWRSANTGALLDLSRAEGLHATWWLEKVQELKSSDIEAAARLEIRHEKRAWKQPNFLKR